MVRGAWRLRDEERKKGMETPRIHAKFIHRASHHPNGRNAIMFHFAADLRATRDATRHVFVFRRSTPAYSREIDLTPRVRQLSVFFSPERVLSSLSRRHHHRSSPLYDILWRYLSTVAVKSAESGKCYNVITLAGNCKPSNIKYIASCRCNPGCASVQHPSGVFHPPASPSSPAVSSHSRRASLSITI